MKRKPSRFTVGDTWICVNKSGSVGTVWLEKIHDGFEVWMWSFCYSDGSGRESDWTTSKSAAVDQCPIWGVRFKRVKKQSDGAIEAK